ncbi:MAG TPA: HrpE/YscL family type III secretion apparatus protein [Rhizobacter sp.]|nr:HrpE/YscL family type III secretion apparatus protein [Rhizobacter sp.]
MTFALRRIDAEMLQHADEIDGVIKASSLAALEEARDVIAQAQAQADQLLDEARTLARQELQQQRDEIEAQGWRQAADYAQSLQAEWDQALASLESRMASLLGSAMRRLIDEVPPEARLRACVKQLSDEAGAPDSGVLQVSASLRAPIQSLEGHLPWPVEINDELPEGTVRLQAAQGRWECALDTAIERLAEALSRQVPDDEAEARP